MSEKSLKLHLGCGHKILPGYVNVDKFGEPDLLLDLEEFPWPWEDNSVEEVVMHHVLEHLGQQTDVYLGLIQELYRVCKSGAIIDIRVPHHRHDNFITDPTHVRAITPGGLSMFSKRLNQEWKNTGAANTTLGLYLDIDFEVVSSVHVPSGEWARKWLEKEITSEALNEAAHRFNNVFEEVQIKLKAIK
ncbi:hypothetical protein Lepto7376_2186 [[Leptolyngbya] sp. PCC 7376]|uniref:class I SAM-dependent methyltransferase n=1 Tax=[Leptolyngbya] sp. PCC 7376 TaxID=111781 RepID=UPI00029EF271|nr:hypothetical protein [[Leptolyngbya] sp. PCC 7376]AFY38477.1 hypothetical protein Lepto7376_2186 [[Leptolyngbya] sp. PCC 7376]